MDNKDPKFITTTFPDMADQLQEQGFVLVSHFGNVWTFLNSNKPLVFDYSKVAFTNKINL